MPADPPDRSTFTPRRSPDVVGSRPPRLDSGRALRRAAVVVVVVAAVALVWVFGKDDPVPSYRGPADDPVTALCRSASDQGSAACATSFFACREGRARIVEDARLPRTARPRQIAIAYVHDAWSDWDAGVRSAAQRGCREGLAG